MVNSIPTTAEAVREQIASWPNDQFVRSELVEALKKDYPGINVAPVSAALSDMKKKGMVKSGKQKGLWIIKKRPDDGNGAPSKKQEKPAAEAKAETAETPSPPAEEQTAPEFTETDVEWGRALMAFIDDLKKKLFNAESEARDFKRMVSGMEDRHKEMLKQKDQRIRELQDQITQLNRRITSQNRQITGKSFSVGEVAKFRQKK